MAYRPLKTWQPVLLLILVFAVGLACARTPNPLVLPSDATTQPLPSATYAADAALQDEAVPVNGVYLPNIRQAGDPTIQTPTPDPQRALPGLRTETMEHVVQAGDSLGLIANRYGVTIESIASANGLTNLDLLSAGQVLVIPPPTPGPVGMGFKAIPDAELVFGPRSDDFDPGEFLARFDSYLARYQEEVDGESLTGAQIVERVAREYSVSPRLLMAVLEYQSGWVTQANPD
jgi:LasA protease